MVMVLHYLRQLFLYSIYPTHAAQDEARQGTYYDPGNNGNTFDTYDAVLAAAQQDVPGDVTLSIPPPIIPFHCLTGQPSSWSAEYPTAPNAGYVYICFDGQETPAPSTAAQTITVTILYNFQPVTPLASVVGAATVHVEASTTMQVQKQQ